MLKTSSVLLLATLAACGTGAPTVTTSEAPDAPTAPVTVAQAPAPTEEQPSQPVLAPAPVQDGNATVVQQPNAPVADPNAVDPNDTNPGHLQDDPVTGKFDFRYGTWTAGPVGQPSNANCQGIHGAALKFELVGGSWYVAGTKNVATFGPDKSVSWIWDYSGDAETWSADGQGTYVFAGKNVSCELTIEH